MPNNPTWDKKKYPQYTYHLVKTAAGYQIERNDGSVAFRFKGHDDKTEATARHTVETFNSFNDQ